MCCFSNRGAQPQPHQQQFQHPSHHQSNEYQQRAPQRNTPAEATGNRFDNPASLRTGFQGGAPGGNNHQDMRPSRNQRKPEVLQNQLADINKLMQMGSQMMSSGNTSHSQHNSSSSGNRSGGGRYSGGHGKHMLMLVKLLLSLADDLWSPQLLLSFYFRINLRFRASLCPAFLNWLDLENR